MIKAWLAVVAVTPLALSVGESPKDLDGDYETRITLGFGTGKYAHVRRGCDGNILSTEQESHQDVGLQIDQKLQWLHLGARGGIVRDRGVHPRTIRYVNPYATLDSDYFELGVGYIFSDKPFTTRSSMDELEWSGHLRLGERAGHLSIRLFEALPFYSGIATEFGFGFQPHERVSLRFGLSGPVPFDNSGGFLAGDVRVTRNLSTQLHLRAGGVGGQPESAIGFGLSYRIPY